MVTADGQAENGNETAASPCGNGRPAVEPDETGSFRDAASQLGDGIALLFSTNLDLISLRVRSLLGRLVLLAIALSLAIVVVIAATVLFVLGGAGAISAMAAGPPWVGQLAVGLVGLGSLAATLAAWTRRTRRRSLDKRIQKYQLRRALRLSRASRGLRRKARAA